MDEKKLIIVLFSLTLVAALVFYLIPEVIPEGDLTVESYTAILHEDGTLTERYVYNVKTPLKYRMLYRIWDDNLTFYSTESPHIEFLGVKGPEGAIGYAKDYKGSVSAGEDEWLIASLAEKNEAGVYNKTYFDRGTYAVELTFRIYPRIEYDEEIFHLNLKLADEHVPYKNFVFIMPSEGIANIYPHPPDMKVNEAGDLVTISGSADKNELVEIEFLMKEGTFKGYMIRTENVRERTEEANAQYYRDYNIRKAVRYSSASFAFALPFLFVAIYFFFGKEKRYTVPRYLSFVPDAKMKPYMVNLLFKKDAFDFDYDGFYATLLDLQRREKLDIKGEGEKISIKIIDESTDDLYEGKVFRFLDLFAINGTVTSERIKGIMERSMKDPGESKRVFRRIRDATTLDKSYAKDYAASGRQKVFLLLFVPSILFILSIICLDLSAAFFSAGSFVELGIALAFPSTLFGKWKEDGYMKKLQWDAFRNFLSDLALIKEYGTEDLSMWDEWLVYGTALGVGDKVEEAMRTLGVEIPLPPVHTFYATFRPVFHFVPYTAAKGGYGGGFGGGSFGGGGGFGGGGAGGR